MATNKRNIRKQSGPLEFTIDHVREFEDGNIAFDLQLGRCMIYGCRIIVTQDKGEFISFPSRCVKATKKGEKDRWYSYARIIDLTDDEAGEIMNAVYEKLEAN